MESASLSGVQSGSTCRQQPFQVTKRLLLHLPVFLHITCHTAPSTHSQRTAGWEAVQEAGICLYGLSELAKVCHWEEEEEEEELSDAFL